MLVRSEPLHPQLPDLNAEIVLGDLSDQATLSRFCTGADAVIHIAGAIKAKSRSDFFSANKDGCRRVALAAADAVPRAKIIHVSSMAAREPELSDYAASKRAGEDALLQIATGPVTILRPCAIYGPWDIETLPLFRMAAKGHIFAPRTENARICLIHAKDVADAVVAAAEHANETASYELCDANVDGYVWDDIAAAARQATGRSAKLHSVPVSALKFAGLSSEASAHIVDKVPMLTRGKIREILHSDWGSSSDRQPPTSWWQPSIGLSEGFADTARWYADKGLL